MDLEQRSLLNKKAFLEAIFQAYHEERLELPQVTEELLNRAHIGCTAAEKWAIYFYFVEEIINNVRKCLEDMEDKVVTAQKEFEAINSVGEGMLLKKASIVGLTTTGAAKYKRLLQMMKSRIVIVEEAAEVQESHIVTSITKYCEHLILIGDHKQLRPTTTVYKLSKSYNFDVSLFERLINNNIEVCQLNVQHRMHPNICKLLVPTIYEDLHNHPSVHKYPDVLGVTKNLFFINHNELEKRDDDSASKTNLYEAQFLIKLCRYLILQGYLPTQITIITTYLGQMYLLNKFNSLEGDICRGVRITVVDNFQGEENDIILLSLVRSNADNRIGFLNTENRICVALSRAKHGMFIIGNMDSFLGSGSPTWQKIHNDLEQEKNIGVLELKCGVHGCITLVGEIEDFQKVPNGGCLRMCEMILACKHSCQSVCHPYDREHKEYKCEMPCSKQCPNNGHQCSKLCHLDCGDCVVIVDKSLPCGHVTRVQCYNSLKPSVCMISVERVLQCGHTAKMLCKENLLLIKCMEKVERELKCGHSTYMNCNENPELTKCKVDVEKKLSCGHNAMANCGTPVSSIKCKEILEKKMPQCDHDVLVECYTTDDVSLWQCNGFCNIRLECGHTCGKACHLNNDPNHLKHKCHKPCQRSCPLGHKCSDFNFEHECRHDCPNCEVPVPRTLPCNHEATIRCYQDVNDVLCEAVCSKELDCGHNCTLKCQDTCLCMTKVKKISVDCTHLIELFCHQRPSKVLCNTKVQANVKSACGHTVLVPCRIQTTASPVDCLNYCDQPCEEILEADACGHKCSGNCFLCFQGRIHQRCTEKCGRVLACGHSCKFPCASLCPPCNEKCEFKCEHSRCNHKCGFACQGCHESCKISCVHGSCKKLCKEECDIKPCDKPCTIQLKCGHSCIGLCGETCPPLCRVCDKETVEEILFGNEDEPDSKFIMLEDCGHVIEVDGMDQYMKINLEERGVSAKKCPKCSRTIQKSRRYRSILCNQIKDIVSVKKKIFGCNQRFNNRLMDIVFSLQKLKNSQHMIEFREFLQNITFTNDFAERDVRSARTSTKHVDQYMFETIDNNMMVWWEYSRDALVMGADDMKPEHLVDLTVRYETVFNVLMTRLLPLSRREITDFGREFHKISAWHKLYQRASAELPTSISKIMSPKFEELKRVLEMADNMPFGESVEKIFQAHLTRLDALLDAAKVKIQKIKEQREVFRAVGFGANHWYKCPNGHFYVIANCGRPNEASRCPECKSTIGGAGMHVLAPGNSAAPDIETYFNLESAEFDM